VPWLVLALGLAVTFVQQKNALQDENQAQQVSFNHQNKEITLLIEQRLVAYEQVLRGVRGLLEASEPVNRDQFSRYVANLRLGDHYPGIQGIGFSPLIAAPSKTAVIERIRQQDLPDFAIRPAGERPVYAPVLFIEPFTGANLRAVGYDVYSEPLRRTAMDLARDTDDAAITPKIVLVQEADNHAKAGFLMYLPVYRQSLPHQTLDERRAHIRGWVSAPFRMDDLMRGILGERIKLVDLEIFDGESVTDGKLMMDTNDPLSLPQAAPARFQSTQQIQVSGRRWTTRLSSRPDFDANLKTLRVTELRVNGVLISVLLAWLVWLLSNARGRAVSLAEDMTQALRQKTAELMDTQARLHSLINTLPDLVWLKNADGVYLACNPRFERFFGAQEADIVGKTDYDFVDPTLADAFRANDKAALASDGLHINEEWVTFADDGHRELLETTKTPMRDANGQLIGVLGISHDITERIQHEQHILSLMRMQKAILDSRLVGIVKLADRQFIWANAFFADMLGYTPEELIGQPSRLIYPSDEAHDAFAQAAYPVLHQGDIYRTEIQFRCQDGSLRWFEISGGMSSQGNEDSIWALVDIQNRKLAEAALQKSEAFTLAILNSVPAEIAVIDQQGVILAVNEHWQHFATENSTQPGIPARQTGVGANYLSISQGSTSAHLTEIMDTRAGIQAVLDGKLPRFQQEYACHSPQQQRWFTMSVTPLQQDGQLGAVITHTDMTERKQLENVVRQMAFHDPLTQLPNRRLLSDRLNQSMAASKRSGVYGALMFLDLDNFKSLNDTHGHDMGDLLLIEVAQRLKNGVREMDSVARFGGDEFVVMISELKTDLVESTAEAARVAEKIRLALAEPYRLTLTRGAEPTGVTVEHHCTASIGVALFVEHTANPEDILKWADLAMYQAKEAGRNRVQFYVSAPRVFNAEHPSTDRANR
jgi:diguanylate cyclase (GGDEF)-like protein/PAS domain S-box-containing protein